MPWSHTKHTSVISLYIVTREMVDWLARWLVLAVYGNVYCARTFEPNPSMGGQESVPSKTHWRTFWMSVWRHSAQCRLVVRYNTCASVCVLCVVCLVELTDTQSTDNTVRFVTKNPKWKHTILTVYFPLFLTKHGNHLRNELQTLIDSKRHCPVRQFFACWQWCWPSPPPSTPLISCISKQLLDHWRLRWQFGSAAVCFHPCILCLTPETQLHHH